MKINRFLALSAQHFSLIGKQYDKADQWAIELALNTRTCIRLGSCQH